MEQIKGSLGSQMQTQQQQQQQQNQSKKKSKNKKKSSKNESNTAAVVVVTTRSNEEQEQQPIEGVLMENGLTDQLKQQLHIGNDNNTNNSCSSSSSSNNKVNGLMTENLKKSKACPPTTTTNDKLQQPALNGHHMEESTSMPNGENSCPQQQAVNKKSKRKPNNKKLNNSLEDKETQLENGHCPEMVTNGFSHQEPQQILTNETKLNTAMTAVVAANNSNQAKSTPSNNTNEKTKAESLEPQPKKEKQEAENETQANAVEPVALSKSPELDLTNVHIEYKEYESELQMHDIMRLIQAELSEPYSIYTYRYFIYNWPKLCFLAAHGNEYVGAIVCKLDMYMNVRRGYIAMLAVRKEYRKLKIGTTLVQKAIEAMLADKADEVVLETEMSNLPALRLYENLGFVRDKRLFRYYLNGVDALRLKLWFR
ncbi:N-alpha-acetyltransferase 30A [Lucilia cuprina]|uniref:N-alpha-acetyltransferase 30A n=1 Tax=Lucilia cuprina TaxID=7375 RepID=UPI001F070EE0|nr:N-alpha-acetyltransferase 30A [Lucilia cuprina]